jgi:hypothetical protein
MAASASSSFEDDVTKFRKFLADQHDQARGGEIESIDILAALVEELSEILADEEPTLFLQAVEAVDERAGRFRPDTQVPWRVLPESQEAE